MICLLLSSIESRVTLQPAANLRNEFLQIFAFFSFRTETVEQCGELRALLEQRKAMLYLEIFINMVTTVSESPASKNTYEKGGKRRREL